ncbi:MAG: hypothetical protein R3236_10990, partial [Phycisphaeraceae bacterium]|nr:hypothetical protein [Phycisphaeraceae bacterium]
RGVDNATSPKLTPEALSRLNEYKQLESGDGLALRSESESVGGSYDDRSQVASADHRAGRDVARIRSRHDGPKKQPPAEEMELEEKDALAGNFKSVPNFTDAPEFDLEAVIPVDPATGKRANPFAESEGLESDRNRSRREKLERLRESRHSGGLSLGLGSDKEAPQADRAIPKSAVTSRVDAAKGKKAPGPLFEGRENRAEEAQKSSPPAPPAKKPTATVPGVRSPATTPRPANEPEEVPRTRDADHTKTKPSSSADEPSKETLATIGAAGGGSGKKKLAPFGTQPADEKNNDLGGKDAQSQGQVQREVQRTGEPSADDVAVRGPDGLPRLNFRTHRDKDGDGVVDSEFKSDRVRWFDRLAQKEAGAKRLEDSRVAPLEKQKPGELLKGQAQEAEESSPDRTKTLKQEDELANALRKKTTEADKLQVQLELAKERIASLSRQQEEFEKTQGYQPENAPTDFIPGLAQVYPRQPIFGQITNTRKYNGVEYVQLNVGKQDKVEVGQRFMIHKDNKYYGDIIITKVDEDAAAGRVSIKRSDVDIQKGFEVRSGRIRAVGGSETNQQKAREREREIQSLLTEAVELRRDLKYDAA